jgi:dTDP-4-dehydrorhamnose reductase
MRVLLLGAGGMLARALRAHVTADSEITEKTRMELDIRDSPAVRQLVTATACDWVFNASGYTSVDAAEHNQEQAFAVNAVAVGALAGICAEAGCGLLHFSTDYVFDGTKKGFYAEDDEPRPLNVYGASKLSGEELLRSSDARHLIVRTQWLYGDGGRSFVGTLWDRAQSGTPTTAVDDQFGGCTYSADLAKVSWALVEAGAEGTYHVANRGRVSRFKIAERIFSSCGTIALLKRASARDFPTTARRPVNSPLSVSKVERTLGRPMPEWRDAIDRYLETRRPTRGVRQA